MKSSLRYSQTDSFSTERGWDKLYEGLPNTYIKQVSVCSTGAVVTLEMNDGSVIDRNISHLEYVIGRRGSLGYLDQTLVSDLLNPNDTASTSDAVVSGRSLRAKVEANLELAPNMFATGSLTGDSLIRHAYGGCIVASRAIMGRIANSSPTITCCDSSLTSEASSTAASSQADLTRSLADDSLHASGHSDLHIDRKARSLSADVEVSKCELWRDSGWWSGGFVAA